MLKKTIWIILGLALLLIISAIIIPILYKPKLVRLIKEEVNKSLTAKLDFKDDIGLSVWENFPELTLTLHKVSLANQGDFTGDTLLSASTLETTFNLMSVIKGKTIHIRKIYAKDARIQAIVHKDGKANWDIVKSDSTTKPTDTSDTQFSLKLSKFILENSYILYQDESMGFSTQLEGLDHSLSGDFTQDIFDINTQTKIKSFNLTYGGITWLKNITTEAFADITMDLPHWKFTFKKNTFKLNALELQLNGWLSMEKDMDMNLSFKAEKNTFNQFMSLIPAIYSSEFSKATYKGEFGFDGFLKGIYNDTRMPAFQIKAIVNQGEFSYPGMPQSIHDVALDLTIDNPDGELNHTQIQLKKLVAGMGKDKLNATMILKQPMADPYIDIKAKADLHLDQMSTYIPLEKGSQLAGHILTDLSIKGNISEMEVKNAENLQAKGKLEMREVAYTSSNMPGGNIQIPFWNMNITPQNLTLDKSQIKVAGSDLTLRGEFDNYLSYIFSNGKLKGKLNFESQSLNVNPWMGAPAEPAKEMKPEDTVAISAPSIPSQFDFEIKGKAGEILYDNLLIRDASAVLVIREGILDIKELSGGMFGGRVGIKGNYVPTPQGKAEVKMGITLKNMKMQEAARYLSSMKKYAPASQYIQGEFSSSLQFNGPLAKNMEPELNLTSADGDFYMPEMKVGGYPPLNALLDALQWTKLSEINIKKVKSWFRILNGKFYIDKDFAIPFKEGILHIYKDGYTALDQTINYPMMIEIPRSELGKADTEINRLLEEAQKKGIRINLNEKIPINISMTGTVKKPIVKAGLQEAKKRFIDELKKQIAGQFKELAEQKKKELEAAARAEADRLKQQATNEAERAKAEAERKAKEETERLKQKANDEANKAKEKAKEEARKKVQGLFKKP